MDCRSISFFQERQKIREAEHKAREEAARRVAAEAKAKEEKEKQQRALQQNTSLNSSYTIPAGQAKMDTSTTKKLHNLDS